MGPGLGHALAGLRTHQPRLCHISAPRLRILQRRIGIKPRGLGRAQNGSCARGLLWCAMDQEQELICLQLGLILNNAVFRDTNAIHRGADGAHAADDHGGLDARHHHGGKITQYHDMADDGNAQE